MRQLLFTVKEGVRKGRLGPLYYFGYALPGIAVADTPVSPGYHAVPMHSLIEQDRSAVMREDCKEVTLSRIWIFGKPLNEFCWDDGKETLFQIRIVY